MVYSVCGECEYTRGMGQEADVEVLCIYVKIVSRLQYILLFFLELRLENLACNLHISTSQFYVWC